MKNLVHCICGLLLLMLLVTCEKEEQPSPEYTPYPPLPYFPVYPGSYWAYFTGTDTSILRVSDHYQLVHGYYLTSIQGIYIKGYERLMDFGNMGGYGWFRFFSDSVGYEWTNRQYFPPFMDETYYYKVMDRMIDQNGDTSILIREHSKNSESYINRWQIFKKHVGKVIDFSLNSLTQDTISKWVLIDYHINR